MLFHVFFFHKYFYLLLSIMQIISFYEHVGIINFLNIYLVGIKWQIEPFIVYFFNHWHQYVWQYVVANLSHIFALEWFMLCNYIPKYDHSFIHSSLAWLTFQETINLTQISDKKKGKLATLLETSQTNAIMLASQLENASYCKFAFKRKNLQGWYKARPLHYKQNNVPLN